MLIKNLFSKAAAFAGGFILVSSLATTVFAGELSIKTVTPANNAKDISVLGDVELTFDTNINSATIAGNVTVSAAGGGTVNYTAKAGAAADRVAVVFTDGLQYEKSYTVTVGTGLQAISGSTLAASSSYTFTTEKDPVTTLFHDDFNDSGALTKFTQIGTMDQAPAYNEGYSVEKGMLKIWAQVETWKADWNNRPILKIKNSDDWRDYQVDFKFSTGDSTGNPNFYPQVLVRIKNYGSNEYYSLTHCIHSWNQDSIGFSNSKTGKALWDTGKQSILGYGAYNGNLRAIGGNFSYKINNEKTNKTFTATDAAPINYGGIAFSNFNKTIYFDDIRVTDMGFFFTVDQIKNVAKKITLTFNSDLNSSTIPGKITVKKGATPVPVTVTTNGTNKIDVTLNNVEADTIYTGIVSKDIASSAGNTMSNDKVFQFKTK